MSREFVGKLTAEEAVTVLTMPVYNLLSGQAVVTFPHTTHSHPSKDVRIDRDSNFSDNDGTLPVVMEGDQYQKAVVPVLNDPLLDWTLPLNRMDRKKYEDRVGHAILESFKAAGY